MTQRIDAAAHEASGESNAGGISSLPRSCRSVVYEVLAVRSNPLFATKRQKLSRAAKAGNFASRGATIPLAASWNDKGVRRKTQ